VTFVGIVAMFSFQQAPFYDADEKAHLGYAHEIADFRLPEIDRPAVVPSGATQWQAELDTGRDDRYHGVWVANHPPLHYMATAPLIWIAEATHRPDAGLLYMRLANAAFAACGVVFTYLLGVEVSGGSRRVGLVAAAIVALVPQGHTYFSRGLNDGLAFAAGTALVWAALRCKRAPGDPRYLVALGAAATVAAGTRTATMLLSVFVVGVVAVARLVDVRGPFRRRVAAAARVAAFGLGPPAVLFGWFFVRIQVLYGDVGASSFLLDHFGRVSSGSVATVLTWGHLWVHLYERMISTAPLSWAWPRFAVLGAVVAVAGVLAALVRPRPGTTRRALLLCLGTVGVITLTVAQHIAGGGSPYPRYFFPVLGVLAVLAAVGFERLVPWLLRAVVVAAMAWWAIRQMPIGVDPVTTLRPRDHGRLPPVELWVLPVGDGWRRGAALLIVAGAATAVTAGTLAVTHRWRDRPAR
jgi:hypothetical protein